MPKSADAFRTISEVSEVLDTPAHVLRFWETRFTQVKPVKRAGGRRYYRPSDIELLAGIKKLLHEDGLTIRGVQKILKEEGVRHVAGLVGPVLAPAKADEETMTGSENAQVAAMEGATAEVLVQPSPDETPHWPEAPAPEAAPVMAGAAFPADPEDPAPETPPPQEELPAVRKARDRWNQPSLFDEPAPEAPMALDVEPDEPAPPLGEVVALNVERAEAESAPAAPVAAAQPEAPRHAPHRIAETLRRIAPAGLSHDQRTALLAAQSRLVALREGLAAQPAARAD